MELLLVGLLTAVATLTVIAWPRTCGLPGQSGSSTHRGQDITEGIPEHPRARACFVAPKRSC
jgi:hypothetical protein